MAIARGALARHELTVATYATWLGPENVQRACELARALGTRVIGAGFSGDARQLAPVLREHGVVLAVENHPEKTPDELLAKIELGRETMAATVDTGWWATQGYDPARAIQELGSHVVHVHLKDVLHEGEPHETCMWGQGIVDVEACLRALLRIDYAGAYTVEHEPEDRPERGDQVDAPAAREVAPMRIAIVGAGNIADRYAAAIAAAPELELAGAADLDGARAEALTSEHGGRAYPDLAAILADDAVDTVVNLTVPQAHYEVAAAALAAGKHVHNEKPLALRHEDAARLVELARSRRPARRGAGDAARGGAADALEARPRGLGRRGARRLRRGELGSDRALAPGSAQPVRGRAAGRRRHLPAHDRDCDVRPGAEGACRSSHAGAGACALGRDRSRRRRLTSSSPCSSTSPVS